MATGLASRWAVIQVNLQKPHTWMAFTWCSSPFCDPSSKPPASTGKTEGAHWSLFTVAILSALELLSVKFLYPAHRKSWYKSNLLTEKFNITCISLELMINFETQTERMMLQNLRNVIKLFQEADEKMFLDWWAVWNKTEIMNCTTTSQIALLYMKTFNLTKESFKSGIK